jgi:hypothetical protein
MAHRLTAASGSCQSRCVKVLWALGFAGLGVLRRSTPSFSGRGPPATGGSPRQTPCLPCTSRGNRWQPAATDFACFCGFECGRFAAGCHRLQPRGSIKAPSSVVGFGYVAVARPRSLRAALVRGPGSQRHADLPLVAEWVDDPAEPPAVLIVHGGRFRCAGGDRLPDDPLRVVDHE